MESSLLKRRKLLLLFLLGVGVPSLALGYLAFRGIRNELALQEQRRLGEHRALSEFLGDTLEVRLTQAEDAASRLVAGRADPRAADLIRTLDDWKSGQQLVEEVFYLVGGETIELPVANLLFHADGSVEPSSTSPWPVRAAGHLRSGQQHEFQQHSFDTAIAGYQSAYAAVADSALKGEALVAIARVQRKAWRLKDALSSCETLSRDYGQMRTAAGVPLGPTARLEHAALLLALSDSPGALRGYLDLFGRLVDGEWELERAQYDFFTGQVGSSFGELAAATADVSVASYRDSLATLKARENRRRERAERLLRFQSTLGGDLRALVDRAARDPSGFAHRFTLESGGQTYLVALLDRRGDEAGAWGLLLDAGYLGDVFLRRTLEGRVDSTTTDWVVRGRDGSTVLARDGPPSGTLSVIATFADNFPPWLIEFYQRPQNPYRRLLASSQSIYFYMFLLIAGILVSGLILTVRAVTHEMELARLKSDFVSTVSHEFKSPLTSIRQLAEMLQAGRVPSEERRQRYYDVLVEQSSRLSSLVTNILDLARIDEGRKEFQFETVDMGELVRELASTTQHRVGHEGFVVEVHVDERLPDVRADRNAIAQALSNLVDNAILYSADARRVDLRASAAAGLVTVAVEDFGVGIPEDEIDKVFDRFYRGGDALTRAVKGSGLGLTLVKEIVEAHGGTVEVASAVGRGSTFSIRLPAMAG